MSYEDDELIEERTFKASGNDEDELYGKPDDPLEPEEDGDINFGKEEESEEEEKF